MENFDLHEGQMGPETKYRYPIFGLSYRGSFEAIFHDLFSLPHATSLISDHIGNKIAFHLRTDEGKSRQEFNLDFWMNLQVDQH